MHLLTMYGAMRLSVNLIAAGIPVNDGVKAGAARFDRRPHLTVAVVGHVEDHTLDLGVRGEPIPADELPADITALLTSANIDALAVQYRDRLANLTVHLACLGLATSDGVPTVLTLADLEFLHHCLTDAQRLWRDGLDIADASANRPRHATGTKTHGHINIEPTARGYRDTGVIVQGQLERVQRFVGRLDQLLGLARAEGGGNT